MSDIPKWQQDLTAVTFPGADMGSYMRIRNFIRDNAELEGMAQVKFFEALDLIARTFRTVGEYE